MIAAAACLACCGMASAPDYPTHPVRIIIPLGPGGGGDVFTRASPINCRRPGQPLVVENRPGGGQNIGGRACAEANTRRLHICLLSSEPVIYNQFLYKSLPYSPEKDFLPIPYCSSIRSPWSPIAR